MPFTAGTLNIGQGLAEGILSGANSLDHAISYVRDMYANSKAATGAMQALAKTNDANGNPIISPSMMDTFNTLSPQAQSAFAGIMSQRAAGLWSAQNQQLLQRSQGQVEQQTHTANTASDYGIARQYGVVPGRSMDQMPAGYGNQQAPQSGVQPGSNLVQPGAPQQPQQPQQAQGALPSHVPLGPQVRTKTMNGQNYAVQHQDPNNPNSPITHVFDPGSGKWVPVPVSGGQ